MFIESVAPLADIAEGRCSALRALVRKIDWVAPATTLLMSNLLA